jgi:molybdopterin adenylyltransferase
MNSKKIKAVAVTISDRCADGKAEDVSGAILVECLQNAGAEVVERFVVSDDFAPLVELLKEQASRADANLIVTTGGTGFAPRDNTPEATRQIIEREAAGISEAIRAASLKKTPTAMLSRGVAGICGKTLIINLPGSPAAVRECFAVIEPVLLHAINLLAGDTEH